MKAKILANATIVIIALCVLLNGYAMSFELPVYADSTTDAWTQVTTNAQMVEAFKYYCKSRDVTINGGIADAVTHFTTKTFNGLCNTLGIDITALQAHLKYQTDGNLGLRYLFDTEGISAYNRIFAQFLQDNDLSVGDENVDKTVESGLWFSDKDGNGCYCFIDKNTAYAQSREFRRDQLPHNGIYAVGTVYNGLDGESIYSQYSSSSYGLLFTKTCHFETADYNISPYLTRHSDYAYMKGININTNNYSLNAIYLTNYSVKGYVGIAKYENPNNANSSYNGFYVVAYRGNSWEGPYYASYNYLYKIPAVGNDTGNVNITIVSNVINNNTYEGDTIINNNGTTGDDDDNPGGGGGGGNTITPPGTIGGNGSDGTINFPDLNLNLPEINWSLGDLSQKFPFSIPFDMIAFLTLLNGEPQAPHITGSIPLTSHYTWELDLDFSQFDTFAGIMRGLEFVGFMFFLISATINIVRG